MTALNGVATAPAFTANFIDGNYLVTASIGISYTADFSLTNINHPSTDIQLSNTTIAENLPAGTVVGTFSTSDPDVGETFTYRQIGGPGTEDYFRFTIDGNTLKTTQILNFETSPTLHIGVCSDDLRGFETCKLFVIIVTDTFEPPTNITLSPSSVPENSPSGTVVGNLSTADLDPGDSFTYSLVPGPGDDDNSSFVIAGAALQTNAILNFEVKNSYNIRIRTLDSHGLEFQKQTLVTVTDVPELVTITVNSLADDTMAGNGACTLREALTNSGLNDTTGGDCVVGGGDLRMISFTVTGIIDLGAALPEANHVNINGPGANMLRIRRNASAPTAFPVFTTAGTTTISGLTVSGGNGFDVGGYTVAGGFLNNGTLTVSNSVITGNSAYLGGGISTYGSLNVVNSLISGNGSQGGGGAIDACGSLTINVINSTLTGNSGTQGGAIHLDCNFTTVNITNSTISHNPGFDGGGIFNRGPNTVNLRNSIVAGNFGGAARNLSGTFVSLGHNLIGSVDSSSGFTVGLANANGDLVGDNSAPIDPLLTALDNHGGPTFTRALLAGSLALGAGDTCVTQLAASGGCFATPLVTDQRGLPRSFNGTIDIGAVQRQATENLVAAAGSPVSQQFANLNITFSDVSAAGITSVEQITAGAAGGLPGGFSLCPTCPSYNIFTSAVFTAPITLCFGVPSITDNATFNQLRVLHGEGNPSVLVNRTSSSDFSTKTICGEVSSLSPFTIAQNVPAPTAAPGSIGGKVTSDDGTALGGVVMELSGAQSARAITNANGVYSFRDVETTAFYTVTPALANYHFAPANRSFSLLANETDAIFTAIPDASPSANPVDLDMYFVRQHYLDFLGREPDTEGLVYWSNEIARCAGNQACVQARRIDVSAAFFVEQEFQQSGSFVYRIYKASPGRRPTYSEFSADRGKVIGGALLERRRQAFANEWVTRADFRNAYPESLSPFEFVNKMYDTAGLQLHDSRQRQGEAMMNNGKTRAAVLRDVIDTSEFSDREYNPSFVLMQYFGYLRRDPDADGYMFWLNALNSGDTSNYRGMVCSFLTSTEYQQRFSRIVSHSNRDCGSIP